MREEAERLFAEHRARGGFAAARDRTKLPEEREALWGLKKQGDLLWEQAGDLVKAASDSVLSGSQVRAASGAAPGHPPLHACCREPPPSDREHGMKACRQGSHHGGRGSAPCHAAC